jgi:hypothetical protein
MDLSWLTGMPARNELYINSSLFPADRLLFSS